MDETWLRWEALEYEHREKTEDWFWALWIIVITAALSSIIYGDYFFAVLIILGGILLAHFAKRQPQVVSYELNYRGLKIGSRIYPYQHIKSFWVEANVEDRRTEALPTFFVKSRRVFMPILSIPIEDSFAPDIQSIMLDQEIIEEEMHEHPTQKIMESLGF